MNQSEIEQKISELRAVIRQAQGLISDLEAEAIARQCKVGEVGEIIYSVAGKYGVPVEEIRGQSRERRVYLARAEAMRRIRQTGRYSMAQIGKFFGDRDHTTVLHALRSTKKYEPGRDESLRMR